MRYLVVGIVMLLCTGCGTLLKGKSQTVKISTTPSEALVKIPDMIDKVPTPTSVKIERGQSYLVEINKPGFGQKWIVLQKRKHRSIILADILFTGGIGIFVDWYTGSWYGVSPSRIDVFLDPISHFDNPELVPLQLTDSDLSSKDQTVELKIYKIDKSSEEQAALVRAATR